MKGIEITPNYACTLKDYSAPLYKSVGESVGGHIEIVNPRALPSPYCMVVNEEGLIRGLGYNPVGSYFYETHKHGSPIVGTIVLMKTGFTPEGPDIVGLEDGDIEFLRKYLMGMFKIEIKEK